MAMSNVIRPLGCFRRPPPEDARPIGRESLVEVMPDHEDGWIVIESSDSGAGILGYCLPKWEAIRIALDYVRTWNAEMRIYNRDPHHE
jgi:hypothetical protein